MEDFCLGICQCFETKRLSRTKKHKYSLSVFIARPNTKCLQSENQLSNFGFWHLVVVVVVITGRCSLSVLLSIVPWCGLPHYLLSRGVRANVELSLWPSWRPTKALEIPRSWWWCWSPCPCAPPLPPMFTPDPLPAPPLPKNKQTNKISWNQKCGSFS